MSDSESLTYDLSSYLLQPKALALRPMAWRAYAAIVEFSMTGSGTTFPLTLRRRDLGSHSSIQDLMVSAAPGGRNDIPSHGALSEACSHLVTVGLVSRQAKETKFKHTVGPGAYYLWTLEDPAPTPASAPVWDERDAFLTQVLRQRLCDHREAHFAARLAVLADRGGNVTGFDLANLSRLCGHGSRSVSKMLRAADRGAYGLGDVSRRKRGPGWHIQLVAPTATVSKPRLIAFRAAQARLEGTLRGPELIGFGVVRSAIRQTAPTMPSDLSNELRELARCVDEARAEAQRLGTAVPDCREPTEVLAARLLDRDLTEGQVEAALAKIVTRWGRLRKWPRNLGGYAYTLALKAPRTTPAAGPSRPPAQSRASGPAASSESSKPILAAPSHAAASQVDLDGLWPDEDDFPGWDELSEPGPAPSREVVVTAPAMPASVQAEPDAVLDDRPSESPATPPGSPAKPFSEMTNDEKAVVMGLEPDLSEEAQPMHRSASGRSAASHSWPAAPLVSATRSSAASWLDISSAKGAELEAERSEARQLLFAE